MLIVIRKINKAESSFLQLEAYQDMIYMLGTKLSDNSLSKVQQGIDRYLKECVLEQNVLV